MFGLKIQISEHAMAFPKVKPPITADMADLVEAYRKAGLIVKKPAAFQLGDTLVVHPTLAAEMRKQSHGGRKRPRNSYLLGGYFGFG